MIGQTILDEKINNLFKSGIFPNFSIFVGEKGSGKKTFIKEHFHGIWLNDVKVDSIRYMIDQSYKLSDMTFIIPDADSMSLSAKNAMLKVIEECPNNNRYIMTLENIDNTLSTVQSRATIFHMDNYTKQEILTYSAEKHNSVVKGIVKIVLDICNTPYEVDLFMRYGDIKFVDYVSLVIDSIAEVSGSNAFKIADKINLKDDESKYDLKLFWKTFETMCIKKAQEDKENVKRYSKGVIITYLALRAVRVTGINKQALFDKWILDIREEWLDGDSET